MKNIGRCQKARFSVPRNRRFCPRIVVYLRWLGRAENPHTAKQYEAGTRLTQQYNVCIVVYLRWVGRAKHSHTAKHYEAGALLTQQYNIGTVVYLRGLGRLAHVRYSTNQY